MVATNLQCHTLVEPARDNSSSSHPRNSSSRSHLIC